MVDARSAHSRDLSALWVQALHQTSSGFILLDEQGCVLDLNPAAAGFLGRPLDTWRGVNLPTQLQDLTQDGSSLDLLLAHTEGQRLEHELLLLEPGGPGWVLFTLERLRAEPAVYAVQLFPIDMRKRLESEQQDLVAHLHAASGELRRELQYRGTHDVLTGLPNRSAFKAELSRLWRQVRNGADPWVLIFLDLDRFKIINDTAGHNAGDALLRWVAQKLRQSLPEGAVAARLGGDEFGVVVPGELQTVQDWAEAWRAELERYPFVWRGRRYDVRVSAGLAALRAETPSVLALMGQADVACHTAKRAGRGRLSVYHVEAGQSLELHRELESAAMLRERLESDQGVLYVQRVVSLDHPLEQRYEVLVRLLDDQGKVMLPTAFVPAAEQYDLMAIVDQWVLECCLQRWGEAVARIPELILHINLSANSLNQAGFLDTLLGLLEASPVPPQRIVFEITETAAMAHLEAAAGMMQELRARGCAVALDDFGVGWSSFDYLRSFPVDFVKVDGSFVQRMLHSEVDRHIVRAIHEVAIALGAQTIAEAAENAEVISTLSEMGVRRMQGFGLHRPESLESLLASLGGKPEEVKWDSGQN